MRIVTAETLDELSAGAARATRKRLNHNLHQALDDPIQRLFNAFEPGTYACPHRHLAPARWEVFVALRGLACILVFDDLGRVTERVELASNKPAIAVEIPAGAWHTLVSLANGTLLFELKPGPYHPLSESDFAPWAPREGQPSCAVFVTWFETAQPGARPPTRS